MLATKMSNVTKNATFFAPISTYLKSSKKNHSKNIAELLLDFIPASEKLKFWCWLKYDDILNIISYRFDYSIPFGVEEFAALRQLVALYSKDKSLVLEGVDPELEGLKKFIAAENRCRDFNNAIRLSHHGRPLPSGLAPLLFTVSKIIHDILGNEQLDVMELATGFGPGANTTVTKKTGVRRKLNTPLCCTKESESLAQFLIMKNQCESGSNEFGRWFDLWGEYVLDEGKLIMVPKDATQHRTIMVETTFNTYIQKGIAKVIRSKLKKATGIDLRRSQDVHRELVKLGSVFSKIATLDEVSASDMIAMLLITETFPSNWVSLLSQVRTGTCRYRNAKAGVDHTFELEKFSSMGNGFTFELESLLFYAICAASIQLWGKESHADLGFNTKGNIRVYGDDIIIPTENFDPCKKGLELCGFVVNDAKSFSTGYFRESCGADYLFGFNIRPFFVRDSWSAARMVGFYNHLIASGHGFAVPLCEYLLNNLLRLGKHGVPIYWGAPGYGDGHLHTTDESQWTHLYFGESNADARLAAWLVKCFRFSLETNHFCSVIAKPNRDDARLRSDSIYYYFTLADFDPGKTQEERFMEYLDDQKKVQDPYSMRGTSSERKIVVQQPGHRSEWLIPSIYENILRISQSLL